jgi:hypothetical protein
MMQKHFPGPHPWVVAATALASAAALPFAAYYATQFAADRGPPIECHDLPEKFFGKDAGKACFNRINPPRNEHFPPMLTTPR